MDRRFYLDFLGKLNDVSILMVGYKCADGWEAAQNDRDSAPNFDCRRAVTGVSGTGNAPVRVGVVSGYL
ncbi:MAG TPA: hypothetical protein VFU86_06430 [Terriglobales bacterium]|nr:hypothetical protein [Terriglobales bacterium]